jgi:O-antigen/teichoic acid export membrane protein
MRNYLKNNVIILVLLNSASVFNYFFQIVVGRSLSPIDYGIFNSLLSLAGLMASPSSIIHIVFSRFIAKFSLSGLGQTKSLILECFKGMIVISGCLLFVGIFFISSIKNYLHIELTLPVVFMLIVVIFSFLYPILFGSLEGLHRFTLFGLGAGSYSITRFLSAVVLVALLGGGVNSALMALIISSGVATAYGFWALRDVLKVESKNLPRGLFSEMGRYSLPVFVSTSMVTLLGSIDIMLVRHYCTPEEAGLYSVGAILGRIALLLPSTLLTVLFPSAAKAHTDGQEKIHILWTSFGLTTLLGGGVALTLNFWPEPIITLLFGAQYQSAASLLQIISIAMALLASCNVIFSYSLARSDFSYLWFLVGGVIFFLGCIPFFHDSASTIAKLLLISVSIILFAALTWLFFKSRKVSTITAK